jgi:CDP-diacylglycerol--glycerol-3-phosphate 3-phosphatidyltransferase
MNPLSIKTKIPIALIILRMVIGFLLIFLSIKHVDHYPVIAISILSIGLISDIFDGIIARHFKVSTEFLRRLDSTADQLFFICIAIATYIQHPAFFKTNAFLLAVLALAEGLAYLLCFIKFKKEIATHTIGAKIWTLFIFATLIQVMIQGQSTVLFSLFFWIGMVTRLEIIAILVILKNWTNDVPTVYHSVLLRQGKEIKRHKLFNG